jgi:hypothetical protein
VDELKTAYGAAQEALDNVRLAREMGLKSLADEQVAAIEAGKAGALYRDALNDQTTAIIRNAQARQSQNGIDQAGIRLAVEKQKTILDVARAQGNEYAATAALIEVKRLEIKLAELVAKSKKLEAEAALLAIKAKREELIASGQLTAAKEAELAAQEATAKVKQLESEIASETARRLRDLADTTNLSGDSANAAGKHYGSLANELRGVADAAGDAAGNMSILNDKSVTGRQGGMDLLGEAYRRGATVEEGQVMGDSLNQLFNAKLSAIGKVANEGDYRLKLKIITNEAINESLAAARAQIAAGRGPTAPATLGELQNYELAKTNQPNTGRVTYTDTAIGNLQDAYRRAGQQAQKNIHTVHINLAGRTTPVNVASPDDASALTGLLKQLEAASTRAF